MTVTLITGANKGLGYETARQLIEAGHTVYVGARSTERGQKAAGELGARFVQLDVTDDVTDDDSVESAVTAIGDAEDRMDVLINNVGIADTYLDVEGVTTLEAVKLSTPISSVSSESLRPRFRCWRSPTFRPS